MLTLATEMKKRGIFPYMAFPDGFPLSEKLKEQADVYINIPYRKFSLIMFFKILLRLKRENIHIVHSHGRGAGIYSRLLFFFGFNVIHTFHGVHTSFKAYVDKILRPFAHSYICVSSDEKSKALQHSFAHEHQIQTINNGISVEVISEKLQKINVIEVKKALGIEGGDKLLVGTLARLDPVKNLDRLIDFVSRWKKMEKELPCQFLIAGDGRGRESLSRLIKDSHLEGDIRLLGEVQNPLNFLVCLDIYVSFSRSEGLPLSVLEAMSVPLPCLLSDIEGHRCLATSGGVSLFSCQDFDDFKSKLEQLLSDGEYKEQLCESALNTVSTYYGIDNMVAQTLEIYNSHG